MRMHGAHGSDAGWWRDLRLAWRRLMRNEHVNLNVLALLVGAIAAGAAILFRFAIQGLENLAFRTDFSQLGLAIERLPVWWVVAIPVAGGLLIGLYTRYLLNERRPHGVADVIEAARLRDGRMSLKNGLAAAGASIASLGVGASVGREGPVVHLGASLASFVGRRLRFRRRVVTTLLGCGVAAAVAASFNAPIAGAFFALEVVVGSYALKSFAPVVMASVLGTILTRVFVGDFPAFNPTGQQVVSFLEMPAYAILGVVSATTAILFMKAVMISSSLARRVATPDWVKPGIAGLGIGLTGVWLPEIMGVGYAATDAALREALAFETLVLLAVAKILATALCLGFRVFGRRVQPVAVHWRHDRRRIRHRRPLDLPRHIGNSQRLYGRRHGGGCRRRAQGAHFYHPDGGSK